MELKHSLPDDWQKLPYPELEQLSFALDAFEQEVAAVRALLSTRLQQLDLLHEASKKALKLSPAEKAALLHVLAPAGVASQAGVGTPGV